MATSRPKSKAAATPAAEPNPESGSKAKSVKQSPADRIRALEAEISRIRQEEHDSRYELITRSIEELNAMGYRYRLVDESQQSSNGGKGAKRKGAPAAESAEVPSAGAEKLSAQYDEKKYCKICREPGHETRMHKNSPEFQEKPFTNEEKARRGVLPPEVSEAFLQEHSPQSLTH